MHASRCSWHRESLNQNVSLLVLGSAKAFVVLQFWGSLRHWQPLGGYQMGYPAQPVILKFIILLLTVHLADQVCHIFMETPSRSGKSRPNLNLKRISSSELKFEISSLLWQIHVLGVTESCLIVSWSLKHYQCYLPGLTPSWLCCYPDLCSNSMKNSQYYNTKSENWFNH
jgi:hypothetical protein